MADLRQSKDSSLIDSAVTSKLPDIFTVVMTIRADPQPDSKYYLGDALLMFVDPKPTSRLRQIVRIAILMVLFLVAYPAFQFLLNKAVNANAYLLAPK